MGFLSDLWGFIVAPLYLAISAVLVGWHNVWGRVFGDESGASWVLSIIGLTLVIRAALIPLFVKQIKSSRNMQLIQPKVKELQKKFGHDRERLRPGDDEALQGLGHQSVRVLPADPAADAHLHPLLAAQRLEGRGQGHPRGTPGSAVRRSAVFGNIKISDTFLKADGHAPTIGLALFLVLAMTATTFLTQRLLTSKNMPKDAEPGLTPSSRAAPRAAACSLSRHSAFPIGVLIYWTTSNLWTMGQQFYVIRQQPGAGTEGSGPRSGARGQAQGAKRGLVPDQQAEQHRRTAAAPSATQAASAPAAGASARPAAPRKNRPPTPSQQPRQKARADQVEQEAPSGPRGTYPTATGDTPSRQDDSCPQQGRPQVMYHEQDWKDDTRGRVPTARDRRSPRGRRDPDRRRRPGASRRPRQTPETEVDVRWWTTTTTTSTTVPPTRSPRRTRCKPRSPRALEQGGDIAADYLKGCPPTSPTSTATWTWTVPGRPGAVSIVGADLPHLVGDRGEVLEALQELTRLAVYRETGERSRLMMDVRHPRGEARRAKRLAEQTVAQVKAYGEPATWSMSPVRAQGGPRRRLRRPA